MTQVKATPRGPRIDYERPEFCSTCPIGRWTRGYVPPLDRGNRLIVGEAAGENEIEQQRAFVGGAGSWLDSLLRQARQPREQFSIVNTIGCQPCGFKPNAYPGDAEWTATDRATALAGVAHCHRHHLEPFLRSRNWTRIVALGDKAMQATTGRTGILLWRGSPLQAAWAPERPPVVMPTLHPAYLMRQADLFSVVVKDIVKPTEPAPERYTLYPSLDTVRAFDAHTFAFDFEWDPASGAITLCGLSAKPFEAVVVPFEGEYITELKRIFEAATDIIGHNIVGADTTYFEQLGWRVSARIWDTMLMQHLVQPGMRHGLAFVASVFTNKVFWKGKGDEREDADGNLVAGSGSQWKTWNDPNGIPVEHGGYAGCATADEAFRLYNARDTDGSLQCWYPLRNSIERYGLADTYWNVSVPLAFICREMSDAGVRIDTSRLKEIGDDLAQRIETLEALLPDGLRPYEVDVNVHMPASAGTWLPKRKTCKGGRTERHDPCDIVFRDPSDRLPCAVCGRVVEPGRMREAKVVVSQAKRLVRPLNSPKAVAEYAKARGLPVKFKPGTDRPTTDKTARKGWAKDAPEFVTASEIVGLAKLKSTFAKDALLEQERMYFRMNPVGTREGRLSSSGKDAAGLNIQNQPKSIRKIYVTDEPGQAWISADVVQGENMLTAWLARDNERLERLRQPGYNEHADLASTIFGRIVTKADPLYKVGKIINHGRNYGMGARKILEQYLLPDGLPYSERDVREWIEVWKQKNRRTAAWQQETTALAERQGFLENVFGRRLWFSNRDFATKALAFLPASTLADVVIRMMIAHYPERFGAELAANRVMRAASICEGWRVALQVHDSIVLMGPATSWQEQARRTESIMTQPWNKLEEFSLGVEVEVSLPTEARPRPAWGDCEVVVE